ncbi:MAG TPA: hypothetical protein VM532_00855 [Burkholderiales bacterium]|jgi:hypothetical protein|nr:hypothetical protein [Burkholderiales bacterium]
MANENENPGAIPTIAKMHNGGDSLKEVFADFNNGEIDLRSNHLRHMAFLFPLLEEFQLALQNSNDEEWTAFRQTRIYDYLEAAETIESSVTEDDFYAMLAEFGIEYEKESIDPDNYFQRVPAVTERLQSASNKNESLFLPITDAITFNGTQLRNQIVMLQSLGNGSWRLTPGDGESQAPIEMDQDALIDTIALSRIVNLTSAPNAQRSLTLSSERENAAQQNAGQSSSLTLRSNTARRSKRPYQPDDGAPGPSTGRTAQGPDDDARPSKRRRQAGDETTSNVVYELPAIPLARDVHIRGRGGMEPREMDDWEDAFGALDANRWLGPLRLIVAINDKWQEAYKQREHDDQAWDDAFQELWSVAGATLEFGDAATPPSNEDFNAILQSIGIPYQEEAMTPSQQGASADEPSRGRIEQVRNALNDIKSSNGALLLELDNGFALLHRISATEWRLTEADRDDPIILPENELVTSLARRARTFGVVPNLGRTIAREEVLDESTESSISDDEDTPMNERKKLKAMSKDERRKEIFHRTYNPAKNSVEERVDSITVVSAPALYEAEDSDNEEAVYFDPEDATPLESELDSKKPIAAEYLRGMNKVLPVGRPDDPMRLPEALADPGDPKGQKARPVEDITFSLSEESKESIKDYIEEFRRREMAANRRLPAYTEDQIDEFIADLEAEIRDDLLAMANGRTPPSLANVNVEERNPAAHLNDVKKSGHANILTWTGDRNGKPAVLIGMERGRNLVSLEDFNARMDSHDRLKHNHENWKNNSVAIDKNLVIPDDPTPNLIIEVDTHGVLTTAAANVENAIELTTVKVNGKNKRKFAVDDGAVNCLRIGGEMAVTLPGVSEPLRYGMSGVIGVGVKAGDVLKVMPEDRLIHALNNPKKLDSGPFLTAKVAKRAFDKLLDAKSRVDTVPEKNRQKLILNEFIDELNHQNRMPEIREPNSLFSAIRERIANINEDQGKDQDYRRDAPEALRRFAEMQLPRFTFDLEKSRPSVAHPEAEPDYVLLKRTLYQACVDAAKELSVKVEPDKLKGPLKCVYDTMVHANVTTETLLSDSSRAAAALTTLETSHYNSPAFKQATDEEQALQKRLLARISDLVKYKEIRSVAAIAVDQTHRPQLKKVKKGVEAVKRSEGTRGRH